MIGKTSQVYIQATEYLKELTGGLVVSIDPSIGSSSSQPGYAVLRGGQYVCSGTFRIDPRKSIPERLRTLASYVRALYNKYPPDVLCYEEIPVMRHGGSAASHASLLKAVGAILSVPGPGGFVGIMPSSWKPMARDTYEKSDENDAVEIAHVVVQLAYQILEDLSAPKKEKTRGSKKK